MRRKCDVPDGSEGLPLPAESEGESGVLWAIAEIAAGESLKLRGRRRGQAATVRVGAGGVCADVVDVQSSMQSLTTRGRRLWIEVGWSRARCFEVGPHICLSLIPIKPVTCLSAMVSETRNRVGWPRPDMAGKHY